MEAITFAGLLAIVVGGYYSLVDLLNDLGFRQKSRERAASQRSTGTLSVCSVIAAQLKIEKMAGMNI